MKKISKLALSSLALSLAVSAHGMEVSNEYIGVEFMNAGSGFKADHGKESIKHPEVAANIFGGFKFTDMFGVEEGFEKHAKKRGVSNVGAGSIIPSMGEVAVGDFEKLSSTFHSYHPYAALSANYTVFDDLVTLTGMAGFSVSKIKGAFNSTEDGAGLLTEAQVALSRRDFKATKIVPVIKLAASTKVMDNLSVRASFTWRNLASFKINSDQSSVANQLRMKDQYSVGIGASYNF